MLLLYLLLLLLLLQQNTLNFGLFAAIHAFHMDAALPLSLSPSLYLAASLALLRSLSFSLSLPGSIDRRLRVSAPQDDLH